VKLIDLPKRVHDRCLLQELFNEMSILEHYSGDSRVCKLYDYGVNREYCYMVMKKYTTSLKSWRTRQTLSLEEMLPTYIWTFGRILDAMQMFSDNKMNHFDLKCDNVLLEPAFEGMSDAEFWDSSSGVPTFSIALADFGESKMYTCAADEHTHRNRGTEFIMSPEMINIARARYKGDDRYDRRKRSGAGSKSDIWSLGCLFYELLTSEFLFYDELWPRFFARLISEDQAILLPENKALVNHDERVLSLLEFMLVRSPHRRPGLKAVRQKFNILFGDLLKRIPNYHRCGPAEPMVDVNEQREKEEAFSRIDQLAKPIHPRLALHYTKELRRILDGIFVGTIAAGRRGASSLHLSHTIICGADAEFKAFGKHIECLRISTSSTAIIKTLKESCDFIDNAVQKKGQVAICCQQGVCWSPAIAIAYTIYANNLGVFEAYLLVRQQMLALRLNAAAFSALFEWEAACKKSEGNA